MAANILKKWEKGHFEKVLGEVKQAGIDFSLENLDEIVEHLSCDIRKLEYPGRCPYYASGKGCHDLEDLNCFLCACPNYESERLEGGCKINSEGGKWHYHENLPLGRVWDCSDCEINHTSGEVREYIEKNFDELKKIFDSLVIK